MVVLQTVVEYEINVRPEFVKVLRFRFSGPLTATMARVRNLVSLEENVLLDSRQVHWPLYDFEVVGDLT